MTLNQIIARLEAITLSHRQLHHFYFGQAYEWLDGPNVNYPACICDVNNVVIDRGQRATRYTVEIWLCDLINVSADAKGNEAEVMSDMISIAEDFTALLNSTDYQNDWTISDTYAIELFKGGKVNEDEAGGVFMRVDVSVKYVSDRCQVPADQVTFESDTMRNSLNTYRYLGLGTEGTSLTIATLRGKDILLLKKGDKFLDPVTDPEGELTPNDYRYTPETGLFEFGNDIEEGQSLQIVNQNL